jgi:hypothetical protein
VCYLAHRERDDRAMRAAPHRLAWAGPTKFTAGPSQRAEASGRKLAQHCASYSDFSFSFTIPEIHINFKNT